MTKKDHRGRTKADHGTYVPRRLLSSDAWAAMSPKAQMIYIWLRLERKGAKFNNNGKIRFSYRQAARCLGVGVNAAMHGFHELQAKGFIVITQLGALGIEGEARGPTYELTDIGMPNTSPNNLYLKWRPENDFEITCHHSNAPHGE